MDMNKIAQEAFEDELQKIAGFTLSGMRNIRGLKQIPGALQAGRVSEATKTFGFNDQHVLDTLHNKNQLPHFGNPVTSETNAISSAQISRSQGNRTIQTATEGLQEPHISSVRHNTYLDMKNRGQKQVLRGSKENAGFDMARNLMAVR